MYAACRATMKVGDGTKISLREETRYPFEETVTFTLSTEKNVSFPFYCCIPSWAKDAEVRVNGKKVGIKPLPGNICASNGNGRKATV